MTDTSVSSAGPTALSARDRRHIMAYYQKIVDQYGARRWETWTRGYQSYKELTPAEEATMLRALLAHRVHSTSYLRDEHSPVETFLSHNNLSSASLAKLVRSGMIKQEKGIRLLLEQANLTPRDRFQGLVAYQGAHYIGHYLTSDGTLSQTEVALIRGVSNHWGHYSYRPLPDKIAQQILDMSPGQKEILTTFLQETPHDMWKHAPRQKKFRELLRAAQNI